MAELTEKNMKQYAMIFAEALKRQGVMSANTSTLENKDEVGVQQDNSFTEYKERKASRKLLKENNKLLDEYLDIQEDINKTKENEKKHAKRRKQIEDELQDGSILLGKSYLSAAKAIKQGDLKRKEVKAFTGSEDLDKLSKDFSVKIDDAGNVMSDSLIDSAENIHTKTNRMITKLYSMINTKAMLAASFTTFVKEFRTGLKYGADLTKNNAAREFNALKMAISPADLIEMEAKNKRLVNVLGGAAEFEKVITSGVGSMFKFYGSQEEATRSTTQALHALSLGGIKPTMDMMVNQKGELSELNKMFHSIRGITGQTFAEQNAAMEEYIKSDVGKTRLAAASNSAERLALVQRNIRHKELYASLGLTAEQATRVSETFNNIAGMDPKERLKESYKAQAIAGAMGIENSQLIGEVIRAGGTANVSAEKAKEYADIMQSIGKKQAEALTGQVTAATLVTGTFMGMSPILREQSKAAMDLSLADKEAAKAAKARTKQELADLKASPGVKVTAELIRLGEIAANGVTTNSLLQLILTGIGIMAGGARLLAGAKGVGGILKTALDSKSKGIKTDIGKNLGKAGFSKIKDLAANAKGNLGKATGVAGKYGSKAVGVLKGAAGMATSAGGLAVAATAAAAGAAAFGVHQAYKAITTGTSDVYEMLGSDIQSSLVDGIENTVNFTKGLFEDEKEVKDKKNKKDMKPEYFAKTIEGINKVKDTKNTKSMQPENLVKTIEGISNVKDKTTTNNFVKPIDKTKQHVLDKKDTRKKTGDNSKMILMQEQMIALQQQNSELMKMTNEILENNFEKMHTANNKYLKSSNDIKTVLESNIDDGLTLGSFDDNSFSFV